MASSTNSEFQAELQLPVDVHSSDSGSGDEAASAAEPMNEAAEDCARVIITRQPLLRSASKKEHARDLSVYHHVASFKGPSGSYIELAASNSGMIGDRAFNK